MGDFALHGLENTYNPDPESSFLQVDVKSRLDFPCHPF